jgi:hypothetical protein
MGIIKLAWSVSHYLNLVGLAATIGGVLLVAFAVVDYLRKHDLSTMASFPRRAWRGPWATAGFVLLTFGMGLSIFVFAVRLMLPSA